ncbi:bifunctional DNA primase/polymerase [Streptomyces canus]|uniref:bifunctional DNA primase/polymerase n=1 Tax=Streptomyces canus TaxID=58343 RepID=UPI0034053B82
MSAELGSLHSDSGQSTSGPSAIPSLAVASWCASNGWPVHPLSPGRKTPVANCDDCRSRHHRPIACPCLRRGQWCHSFHAATLDQERINRWWGEHPNWGIGVSCGPANLIVLDIDAHETVPPSRDRVLPGFSIPGHIDLTGLANGFHTLAILAALHDEPSPAEDTTTLRVRTPSGGLHVWYQTGEHRRWQSSVGSSPGRALAWQVDIRAQKSYIVAPGTATNAGIYTPIGKTLRPAPVPLWLALELERTGHLPSAKRPSQAGGGAHPSRHPSWTGGGQVGLEPNERLLTSVLDPVKACGLIPEGAGFSTVLNRAAYTVGGLIAAKRLQHAEAEQALRTTAGVARPGQERRIDQIIRTGLAAGLTRPLYETGKH